MDKEIFSADECRRAQALAMAIDARNRAGFFDEYGVIRAAAEFEKYLRDGREPSKEGE